MKVSTSVPIQKIPNITQALVFSKLNLSMTELIRATAGEAGLQERKG